MVESTDKSASEDSQPPARDGEDRSPQSRQDQLGEISKLLKGEQPDDQGKPPKGDEPGRQPGQGEDPQKPGKLETLDAVAEKLGVDVSALYDVTISQPGDGEDRVTLGQLKDMAKDRGQLELDRLEFDESKTKREADLMRAQQEINEVISLLPKNAISRELLDAVGKKMSQTKDREQRLTLNVIPEWKDENVQAADRKAMSEHLSQYGFAANYLDQVHDHRTVRYIRDNWQRQRNMERALEAMKRSRGKGSGPATGGEGAPAKPAPQKRGNSRRPGQAQQVEAVAEILRGKK